MMITFANGQPAVQTTGLALVHAWPPIGAAEVVPNIRFAPDAIRSRGEPYGQRDVNYRGRGQPVRQRHPTFRSRGG